jgi:hypothetical protein
VSVSHSCAYIQMVFIHTLTQAVVLVIIKQTMNVMFAMRASALILVLTNDTGAIVVFVFDVIVVKLLLRIMFWLRLPRLVHSLNLSLLLFLFTLNLVSTIIKSVMFVNRIKSVRVLTLHLKHSNMLSFTRGDRGSMFAHFVRVK